MVYLTSLGWLMALPIAGGVLLGHLLDDWLGSGHVWMQVGLGVGIGLALAEAYVAARLALRQGHRE